MPIFEYKCSKCGHTMEFLEKAGNSRKHTCEKCGSTGMEKLLSGFAVGRSAPSSASCDACQAAGGSCGNRACDSGTCPMP